MTAEWDQSPAYTAARGDGAESQTAEGGANAIYNCVPATYCKIVLMLGGPHVEPQELTDAAYSPGWHGGESYDPVEAAMRARWPAMPPIAYSLPGDTLASVDAAGAAGHPVHCSFWCDSGGNILAGPQPFQHVSPVVAHKPGQVWVDNMETDQAVALSDAEFVAATLGPTVGALGVWQTSIGDPDAMTTELALGLARIALPQILGREPTMPQVQEMAGHIATMGYASALDHWQAMAAQNNERDFVTRIAALEAADRSAAPAPAAPAGPLAPFNARITPQ